VVALVALVRGWMHFSITLVQGVNGAYYLVQARAILERGNMAIADFPLTFGLHAGLSKLIQSCTSWSMDHSTLLAVKATDTLLPALAAIPIMALLDDAGASMGTGGRRARSHTWTADHANAR
jgi:hypothetical protein